MEDPTPDPLSIPSPERLREISAKQDARAKELRARRAAQERQRNTSLSTEQRVNAAELIQRHYRGYRERRQIKGYALDPSTRWVEV